eukprot:TRINITY_DN11920_c0_g1_i1.p1 TRINITY_DN11920_c0_g1~~TRINITY_DN11920_c0_g1_i1.p1  ORF type:complete len:611 (-),score=139.88 TRINITY_DN11920_c0_g1_i1:224-2056(-)
MSLQRNSAPSNTAAAKKKKAAVDPLTNPPPSLATFIKDDAGHWVIPTEVLSYAYIFATGASHGSLTRKKVNRPPLIMPPSQTDFLRKKTPTTSSSEATDTTPQDEVEMVDEASSIEPTEPPKNDKSDSELKKLLEKDSEISVVRKTDVFKEDVTEEEQSIIRQRTELMQLKFAEFEKREIKMKVRQIREMHPYMREAECIFALKNMCENREEEVIEKLTSQPITFLHSIRKQIAVEIVRQPETPVVQERLPKHIRKRVSSRGSSKSNISVSGYITTRLRLDDALKLGNFEGWSSARIRAYKCIKDNPNSYYYRFNAPGEAQRNGKWSPEEKELFLKRVTEIGITGQWGIFAMAIPGRVGYQCANFYRQLIAGGELKDENYAFGPDGKLHYMFSNGPAKRRKPNEDSSDEREDSPSESRMEDVGRSRRTMPKSLSVSSPSVVSPTTNPLISPTLDKKRSIPTSGTPRFKSKNRSSKKGSKRRKRTSSEDESSDGTPNDDDNDEDYEGFSSRNSSSRRRAAPLIECVEEDEEDQVYVDPSNPLPDFIDPFTLEVVNKPAISPYGHVAGYDGWVKALQGNNRCPFTKKPLNLRELVKLTFDNIEQYRSKITSS